MPDLGKYTVQILWSYGAAIGLILALIWATWAQSRRVRKALDAAQEAERDD